MIALAYILAAALVGSIGLSVWLTYKVVSLSSDYAAARISTGSLTGELKTAAANLATANNRADSEKARADALDNVLADYADDGPVAGSFERLLQKWKSARVGPADITSTRQLHPTTEAATAGSSDLMRPGD